MTMSPDQQWISTVSMNRFYDHCYSIECAYHIISRYCCSFTNLLNHDDGSIPYYLVQKVKIAVEYGKMLLNSRYRPFQHHLRGLGAYDYIDQNQYEGLCVHWNAIKAETQVVEMFFNQISLLIYPVISAASLPFMESKQNDDRKRNVQKRPKYFTEEELGSFIVNNIIEPLFDDEDEPKVDQQTKRDSNDYLLRYDWYRYKRNDQYDIQLEFDKVEMLNVEENEVYNININNDIVFKFEDEVTNRPRYNSQFRFANRFYGVDYRKYDAKGDIDKNRNKYGAKKHKYVKKNQERGKLSFGGHEFINKKFADGYQLGKNLVRVE